MSSAEDESSRDGLQQQIVVEEIDQTEELLLVAAGDNTSGLGHDSTGCSGEDGVVIEAVEGEGEQQQQEEEVTSVIIDDHWPSGQILVEGVDEYG